MKKIYLLVITLFVYNAIRAQGSANLPHVLTFTQNDEANWSDGIVRDGDGGSSAINGLDIEIFTAGTDFSQHPGSTMHWYDNSYYFSSDASYNGITSGPDIEVTNNGVPAMVMRSINPSENFSLDAIQLYDWGGVETITIEAYNNNALIGGIDVVFDIENFAPKTISKNDELLPSIFSNIDEIRFFPKAPSDAFYLSLNNISLAEASTLPVQYNFFRAEFKPSKIISLEWETLWEQNSSHFEIEVSTNNHSFEKVGTIQASGNSSSPEAYRYDYRPGAYPEYLFRLKQVDLDGRENFSKVITVKTSTSTIFIAGPNPTNGKVYIQNPGKNIQQLRVYNNSGILQKVLNSADLPEAG